MRIMQLIGGLSALSLVCLVTADGEGALTKLYPGVQCHRTSGGIYATFGGTIYNNHSTDTMSVICPLLADALPGFSTTIMWAFDRHPSQNVACNIFSESYDATGVHNVFTPLSTTGSGLGVQTPFNTTGQTTGNFIYASCAIPPLSAGEASHLAGLQVSPRN